MGKTTYPWGDKPFTMGGMMVCMVATAIINAVALIIATPAGVVGAAFPAKDDLFGVGLVSLFWVLCIYIFYGQQVALKFDEKAPRDIMPTATEIAGRSVGNTLEQALPFLVTLWIHALFVNPKTSVVLGAMYVVFRYLYTIFFGMFGTFNTTIEISTQQNYNFVIYCMVASFYKYIGGNTYDLHTDVSNTWPGLMVLVSLGCSILCMVIFLAGGNIGAAVIKKGVLREMNHPTLYETDDESS